MKKKIVLLGILMLLCIISVSYSVEAKEKFSEIDTGIEKSVYAIGQYSNWDGVSTVSQFYDEKGEFCFAYLNSKNKVVINKTSKGKITGTIKVKLKGEKLGTVVCDSEGYFYVISGTADNGADGSKNTVFVTKYNPTGKKIKTKGINDDIRIPFDAGTCDTAVNGNNIAIYFGRKMYSGHQSSYCWVINKDTFKEACNSFNYQSHSFGQRVVPYSTGFAFMSEGDCYDRGFSFSYVMLDTLEGKVKNVFDFYVEKGTLDDYNMFVLNNNFAHIGNICTLNNGNISFVASSVKSMNENAEKEMEQIFIQIFNPQNPLSEKNTYITKGERSGTAGNNGDEDKTNYGVKWLTNYKSGKICNPQAVTDGKGNTIVLYEKYDKNGNYNGIYSICVNSEGKVIKKAGCISKSAFLNSCETPVYYKGYIYWCGNKTNDSKNHVYIFKYSM